LGSTGAARGARFARLARGGGRGNGGGQHSFGQGDRGFLALQGFEARDHGCVFLLAFAFRPSGFNGAKDPAQHVHEREQAADDGGIGGKFSVPQQAEQVFSSMGERFEPAEAEEASGALDGVHGAENIREQLRVAGARLQVGEAPLHAVQTFLAFEKEFASQVVHEVVIGRGGGNLRPGQHRRRFCDSLRDA
jgi:hypothetical protein